MIIGVACSQCGKKYDVPGRLAGKKVRCKECHANFRVPVPSHAPVEEAKPEPGVKGSWTDEFFGEEADEASPLADPRKKRKSTLPDLGASRPFVFFLIVAAAGSGVGATWGMRRAWAVLFFAILGGFALISSFAGWDSFARSWRFRIASAIVGEDLAKLFHRVVGLALLMVALLLALGLIAWPSSKGHEAEAAAAPIP